MMAKVDEKTFLKLVEYHVFHGDRFIKCKKVIKSLSGHEYYLMRFENERGVKCSSIDTLYHGKDDVYVSEEFSQVRESEKEMLTAALRFINEEEET